MNAASLADRPGVYTSEASMDASDLSARARRGDGDAFRLIFERYTRPVASFISCMVGRRDVADELAQETFVRAYRNLPLLRDEAKLSTWLFGIARNVALEHLRARRREGVHVGGAEDAAARATGDETSRSPDETLMDKELGRVVREAVAALDEDKRVVFALKVYQQRSYDEISEITGFSPAKVRNDLHRARAEMRRRLAPYMGVERK